MLVPKHMPAERWKYALPKRTERERLCPFSVGNEDNIQHCIVLLWFGYELHLSLLKSGNKLSLFFLIIHYPG